MFYFSIHVTAQTWKTDIQRTSGKPAVRTLKLKPKTVLRIGTLMNDTDSIKDNKIYYGKFLGGTKDSLQLKIISIENQHTKASGLQQRTITQAKYYIANQPDTVYRFSIALSEIHSLNYQTTSQKIFAAPEDPLLFGSIAMLILSPLICYNYKEGTFNA